MHSTPKQEFSQLALLGAGGTGVLDRSTITSHSVDQEAPAPQSPVPDLYADPYANLAGCGGETYRHFQCSGCGAWIDVQVSCGRRSCEGCRQRAYEHLRRVWHPLLEQVPADRLALVTLTMRIGTESVDLAARVERIRRLWRRLIRQRVWSPVVGGLYTIECKWSSRFDGAWNVHIHALVEAGARVVSWRSGAKGGQCADIVGAGGGRLTMQALSAAWQRLTGDSHIVDISPLDQAKGGAYGAFKYVLKYMTKETGLPSVEAAKAYDQALAGKRLVQPFGTWHAQSKAYRFIKAPAPEPVPCRECGEVGLWVSEWHVATDHEQWQQWHKRWWSRRYGKLYDRRREKRKENLDSNLAKV